MTTRLNTITEVSADEDDVEIMLNDCYGTVTVCGYEYDQGTLFRQLDPIAFRCAVADEPLRYECGTCHAIHEDDESALDCCPVFECDICGLEYGDEGDAEECECSHDEEDDDD